MRRPTFCSTVEQQHSAGPSPAEKESRLSKVKRMITGGILLGRKKKESEGEKENNTMIDMDGLSVCLRKDCVHGQPLKEVHIEVASSATTEIVLKPRKRKERLDSGGSLNLETKVIRSSSEERPEVKTDLSVRRVWSHEELGALVSAIPNGTCIGSNGVVSNATAGSPAAERPLRELNPCPGEELEARRSSERFSRGHCAGPRRRKVSRRAPPPERRSPSPSQPKLDVSSLCRQIEGDEPLTSRGNVLSPDDEPESPALEALISPRNSLVMRLTYLDPNLPPSPPQTHMLASTQQDKQERRLRKQMNDIKRQLKRYEEGFRVEFGYMPSQADKMANSDIKRLCLDLSRLKSQLSQLKEGAIDSLSSFSTGFSNIVEVEKRAGSPSMGLSSKQSSKSNKTMEDAVQDIQKRLSDKRNSGGRSIDLLDMSREQLIEEKLAVQKALLNLENSLGRPIDPRDRDLARPLYQRYRALKRLVARNCVGKLNSSNTELATILEHETMEFNASVSEDQGDGCEDLACGSEPEILDISDDVDSATYVSNIEPGEDMAASSSSSESLAENLHALPLSQLLELQKRVKEDKKRLRRNLREFEEQFQSENGRRAQKQDRLVIESIYVGYKQAKAKLRLLEALIAKKSQVKRNSC